MKNQKRYKAICSNKKVFVLLFFCGLFAFPVVFSVVVLSAGLCSINVGIPFVEKQLRRWLKGTGRFEKELLNLMKAEIEKIGKIEKIEKKDV